MAAYSWTLPQVLDLTIPEIRWLYDELSRVPTLGLLGLTLFKQSDNSDTDKKAKSLGAESEGKLLSTVKELAKKEWR